MVFTNPGAISNSGADYFTNQRAKIYKLNLNLEINGDIRENIMETITNKPIQTNFQDDYRTVLLRQRLSSKVEKLINRFSKFEE